MKNLKRLLGETVIIMMLVFLCSEQVSAETIIGERWRSISSSGSTQGMCMDDDNNKYVAKLSGNYTTIYKYNSKTGSGTIVYSGNQLGHANDLTYCPKDGNIYVATGGGDQVGVSQIVAINPSKKKIVKKLVVKCFKDNSGKVLAPTGITYDCDNEIFFLKKGKKVAYGKFKTNNEFDKYGSFTLDYGSVHKDYTNQGLTAYEGQLYVPLWDKNGKKNSVIRVYNIIKKSNKSYSVKYECSDRYDNNANKNSTFEIEGVDFSSSGHMFFATNEDGTPGLYKVEIYRLIPVIDNK